MTASDFNDFLSDPTVAASLHYVSGYQVGYDSEKGSDRVRLTLLQFATSSDAQNFQSGFELGGAAQSHVDPAVPNARDYDSTTATSGAYDHGVIGTKGNRAFVVDYLNGSSAPVPLVRTLAHMQYTAL
jgi:hypothetical protein